ncbi:MAG: hypothetical protein ACOX7X_00110 [Methanosarcina flavescens]|jgi:hypothetical protein|uniref:Tetratricopeptide repeat protein n=1 Tax=Methanosarcina flavescens TaxID=1715806 RepID=A0A660HTV1_9EURY|nr:hypothetical protein [Methanosarcina flavescens]AYK15682.1 hypothetical protein AOB57_011200 [Methanosarcina flavescens]NLK31411.1 hypothetical protein [Methanosarcina flavescens]
MSPDTGNKFTEGGDDSLSRYLKPDSPEIKEIKSLQGKEYEYSDYLGTIEYSIARYFYENDRGIKDKDAVAALNNIKNNYDKKISFFEQDLEIEIIENLIELLEDEPISHHEFKLAIDYVLEVIDNRSWMEDDQAYLKWAAYVMGLFTEKEREEYETEIRKLAARMGFSSKHADLMLMKGEEEDYFEFVENYGAEGTEELTDEELIAEMEKRFLSMPEDEKFDFLLENGPEFYELVGLYLSDLSERGEFDKIQTLYRKLTEKYDDFLYLYVYMGGVYLEKDPSLAKSYFEKALETLDRTDELSDSTREVLRAQFLNLIKKLK